MPEPRGLRSGVLALFDERERMLAAIRRAKADGLLRLTAYAPAYDCELVESASPASIGIGPFTFGAGLVGGVSGLGIVIFMALQWPTLIVGGKPLVSLPPFLVIAFETTILFAVCATVAVLIVRALVARPRAGALYDERFTDGFFGLWIECPSSRVSAVVEAMRVLGAIECRVA